MKRVIVFAISLILAMACAFEIWLAFSNVYGNRPVRIAPSEINVAEQFEQWFGAGRSRHKEYVTIAIIDEKMTVILGMDNHEGWVFPTVHPNSYRMVIVGADSSTDILQFYRLHPYVRLLIGGLVAVSLFALCSFICVTCIRSRKI